MLPYYSNTLLSTAIDKTKLYHFYCLALFSFMVREWYCQKFRVFRVTRKILPLKVPLRNKIVAVATRVYLDLTIGLFSTFMSNEISDKVPNFQIKMSSC